MPLSPNDLTANADVAEQLQALFDIELDVDPAEPVWFTVEGARSIAPFGRDGGGGVFAQTADPPGVLYVSSEGAAGSVAAGLDEFVQLVVACPYWLDLLKFSGGGKLAEMRRAAAALEAQLIEDDEVDEARAFLTEHFGLPEAVDPVGALHLALSRHEIVVGTPHGAVCESLFNRFTIDDNPMLRDLVD